MFYSEISGLAARIIESWKPTPNSEFTKFFDANPTGLTVFDLDTTVKVLEFYSLVRDHNELKEQYFGIKSDLRLTEKLRRARLGDIHKDLKALKERIRQQSSTILQSEYRRYRLKELERAIKLIGKAGDNLLIRVTE